MYYIHVYLFVYYLKTKNISLCLPSHREVGTLFYLCPLSSSAQLVSVVSLLWCRRSNTRRWPDTGLMLAPVCNAGPALNRHWFNASCLLSLGLSVCAVMSLSPFISLQGFLWYRRSNTRRWPNAWLMLAHRLRDWANISPVLGYRVVFGQRWLWVSVTVGGPTLTQLWFKASWLYYTASMQVQQNEVLTSTEWILANIGDAGPLFNRHWVGVGL